MISSTETAINKMFDEAEGKIITDVKSLTFSENLIYFLYYLRFSKREDMKPLEISESQKIELCFGISQKKN